jgi:hypothetical protein
MTAGKREEVARLDTRIDNFRTEIIDRFEHADKQFRVTHDRLRDIAADITVIHRRVERLEELGASNAGFAKEIDHLLTRVAEIEKHLGIDKKIAASLARRRHQPGDEDSTQHSRP